MPLLRLIQRYKTFDFTGFTPVRATGDDGTPVRIGWTKMDVATALAQLSDTFALTDRGLLLNPHLDTYAKRTEAVDQLMLDASEQGILPEKPDYESLGMGGDDWFVAGDRLNPLFEMRRFYSIFLGLRRYASRVHGFEGDQMWIVKRGQAVHEYPGRLDTLVGAGQVAGRTIREHTLVEAHEEAGLSEADCAAMAPAGMVHIFRHNGKGFCFDENIYIYDLDTTHTAKPHPVQAWESESITLWPFAKVLETIRTTDDFRPEAALCLIDFFIRHGYITPDNEPDYDALCFGVRSLLPHEGMRR